MLGGFVAQTAEYQLRLVAECKEENTVITIVVLTNTSVREIREPAVLERTTPAV